jgi:hypothetical protein
MWWTENSQIAERYRVSPLKYTVVVKIVIMPACHAGVRRGRTDQWCIKKGV